MLFFMKRVTCHSKIVFSTSPCIANGPVSAILPQQRVGGEPLFRNAGVIPQSGSLSCDEGSYIITVTFNSEESTVCPNEPNHLFQ